MTGQKVGICIKWVPGSALPARSTWERPNSEAIEVWIDSSLFADDTTVVGDKEELQMGVDKTKEVMSWWEEKNNDDKEEKLEFGQEGSGEIRMLGCWMGWQEDVKQRLARGRKAWGRLRNRLVGSKLSKKMH